jgi:transcriptional regulator with GAF, ATPase, and Fis domain
MLLLDCDCVGCGDSGNGFKKGEEMEKAKNVNSSHLPHGTAAGRSEMSPEKELMKKSGYSREIGPDGAPFYLDDSFIFFGEKMNRIKEIIDQVAGTDVTVLIHGETGVGKEVVARVLHLNSPRRDKAFIKVNCAALPEQLLESELFGYEKGAFTGAYQKKPGKFELAHRGTIFLDEIGDISPSLQAKLLRVIQDGGFSRLGGERDIKVDVRVLVATNKDLKEAVGDGRFRRDLYYRLNVVDILIPPLRERRKEIPIFVKYFLDIYGKKYGDGIRSPSQRLVKVFMRHHWPGNLRELENMIKRLAVFGDEAAIIDELTPEAQKRESYQKRNPQAYGPIPPVLPLKEVSRRAVKQAEREAILNALRQTNWNRKMAAKLLRISYKAILNKIKEYDLARTPEGN